MPAYSIGKEPKKGIYFIIKHPLSGLAMYLVLALTVLMNDLVPKS